MKKARLIAIAVLGLLTVGGLVYFFKPSTSTPIPSQDNLSPGADLPSDTMIDDTPPQGYDEREDIPPPAGEPVHDQDSDIPPLPPQPYEGQQQPPQQQPSNSGYGDQGSNYGGQAAEPPRQAPPGYNPNIPPGSPDDMEDMPPIEDYPPED